MSKECSWADVNHRYQRGHRIQHCHLSNEKGVVNATSGISECVNHIIFIPLRNSHKTEVNIWNKPLTDTWNARFNNRNKLFAASSGAEVPFEIASQT